jgi:hypothetical protein
MSISASDIIYYASANMPENNTGASGGAIDTTSRVVFTDISTTDNITVISDAAGDNSQTVTIYGRDASGAIVNEALSLNGTSRVTGAQLFERILKIVVSAPHTGTITVTRDNSPTFTVIATIESGVLTIRRLFYDAASDVSGGSARDFYEKIFIKNTHATLALNSAVVKEQADPTGFITFDLEDAKNDNNSVANRLSAPTGMLGTFTNADKNVPTTSLAPGDRIGVWLKLSLAAGESAAKSTYTVRITGTST